jgi:periplasmic protein TonB
VYATQTTTSRGARGGAAALVIAAHIAAIYVIGISLGVVDAPPFVPESQVVFIETPEPVKPAKPLERPKQLKPDMPEPVLEPVIAETVETAPTAPPVEEAAPVAIPADTGPVESASLAVTRRIDPVYPPASRRMDEEGAVLLKVLVDERGSPRDVQIAKSSGFPRLDNAAASAVRRWKFSPATQASQPVKAWTQVNVIFRLDR